MPSRIQLTAGLVVSLIGTGLVTGCVSTTTGRGDIATWYDRSFMLTATQDGTLPVVVHGKPAAGLDAAATAQLMTANIAMPSWLPNTRLVPCTSDRRYRMVLIFNPARPGMAKLNACGDLNELAVLAPTGKIEVTGAVCDGRDAASRTRGAVDAGGDAEATTLRLLRQVMVELIPSENPAHRANIRADGP